MQSAPLVLSLRDYQQKLISDLSAALRLYRRVVAVLPTGGGKTAIGASLAMSIAKRSKAVMWNCHRKELVEQTSRTWTKYGIAHGFIAASRPRVLRMANIASIDTLKNRLANTPEPDFCIWDECHHITAAGWLAIMEAWPNCYHIGLTATPWRTDGTGLGRAFQHMVIGPTSAELMAAGHLSAYEIYAPNPPDMSKARTDKSGEFTKAAASAGMDVAKRTGDMVRHWRRYANGMRTIAFAINVADSLEIVRRFNEAGIAAAHLDAETDPAERERTIKAFARGEILVLSNVGLFGEGFDLSAIAQMDVTIDCLIDAAPTQSLAAALQRWGRVLRPKDYPAIILDHAGNSNRHGFPDDPREWSLADREKTGKGSKSEGPPPPWTCKQCARQNRVSDKACRHCGQAAPVVEAPAVTEGTEELTRVTEEQKRATRQRLRAEENAAQTLPALIALGARRGYKEPTRWAMAKFSQSSWRKELAQQAAAQTINE